MKQNNQAVSIFPFIFIILHCLFIMCMFVLASFCGSGVMAEYSNNELLFVYKNLLGNRNPSQIGIYDGRRSGIDKSPISGDISK